MGHTVTPLHPEPPTPTFFVLADPERPLPERPELEVRLARWILRELSGWVQLVILGMLAEGRIEIVEDAVILDRADPRKSDEQRLIVVRCQDRLGARRPGLWAARCAAEAIAEFVAGTVVDPRQLGLGSNSRVGLRPPADARVHVVDHLAMPCSAMESREQWLTTVGMAHFGLPDLEIEAVPPGLTEIAGRLLLGVAQHMVDGSVSAPRSGCGPREILLTLGELYWALGRDPWSMPARAGRGWTRIVLTRDQGPRPADLVGLRAPFGARSNAASHWIPSAWLDLVGRPSASAQQKIAESA